MTPTPAQLADRCQGVLHGLLNRCDGLQWAAVSTWDGTEVAHAGEAAHDALAAMSGTMHALADGMATEAALGPCRDITLSSEHGRIVILSVPPGAGLVLSGLASPALSLGMLLTSCATACAELAELASPGGAMAG